MIKDLEQEKVFKYLSVNESSGMQHVKTKQKLKKELVRRTWLILKTELTLINLGFLKTVFSEAGWRVNMTTPSYFKKLI